MDTESIETRVALLTVVGIDLQFNESERSCTGSLPKHTTVATVKLKQAKIEPKGISREKN